MEIAVLFDRLGFPKHSGAIFELLEKSGPLSISGISKKLRVHRPAIYRANVALIRARIIVEKSFGRRILFVAAPRSRLSQLFTQTAREIEKLETTGIPRHTGAIRYIEGEGSIAAIFNDVLEHCKRGETFYRYTSEKSLDEVNSHLPKDYRTRRDAKRLERLVISNPESGSQKRNRLERFIKFLGSQKESFHQNAIQLIYGDRIAFLDLNSHKGIVIENSTLAEFQKTIFRALYKRL